MDVHTGHLIIFLVHINLLILLLIATQIEFTLYSNSPYYWENPDNKLLLAVAEHRSRRGRNYYGTYIGNLTTYAHDIRGDVYVIDESTLFLKNFSYDGGAPTAYFWVGSSNVPSPEGIPVPYPEHRSR